MLLRHCAEQRRRALRRARRSSQRHHAGHGVALVRQRGRATAARRARLVHLADFGLCQQRQVAREFAERAGEHRHLAAQRDPGIALGVPGRVVVVGRRGQAEQRRSASRHSRAFFAERGQRAHRATALDLQGRGRSDAQPLAAADQWRHPTRDLEAQADDRRGLHQRAREHGRIAFAHCQGKQAIDGAAQIGINQRQRPPRGQHHGAVDHVLAGAAPMHPWRGLAVALGDQRGELLDQWNGQAARAPRVVHQRRDVDAIGAASGRDCCGRHCRDDADIGLGARQRSFEIEHRLHDDGLAKGGQHLGRREHALEGVGGHAGSG